MFQKPELEVIMLQGRVRQPSAFECHETEGRFPTTWKGVAASRVSGNGWVAY